MVTQLFKSSQNNNAITELVNDSSNIVALPLPVERTLSVGISQPRHPNLKKTSVVPLHQYKGGYRETFSVAGSPYGDQWLCEATASVETEIVKCLLFLKSLNPTTMLCLFFSLLPLLCLWFAV